MKKKRIGAINLLEPNKQLFERGNVMNKEEQTIPTQLKNDKEKLQRIKLYRVNKSETLVRKLSRKIETQT